MALILNIETSSETCSICLSENGQIVKYIESTEKNGHSTFITPFIDVIIEFVKSENKKLDAVAFSEGPGSYTGLRIGLSAAKAVCFAYDIPLICIPTLKIVTAAAIKKFKPKKENTFFCPLIDARRMDVYDAVYDVNFNEIYPVINRTIEANSYNNILNNNVILFFGSGSSKLKPFVYHENAIFLDVKLSSKYMIELSNSFYFDNQFSNLHFTTPNYIKNFQVIN